MKSVQAPFQSNTWIAEMLNDIATVPILASLEEAVSYLHCGEWHRFPELDPWDIHDVLTLLQKTAHQGLVSMRGSPRHGCGPIGPYCEIASSFFLHSVEFEPELHRITAIDNHPRWSQSYIEVQVCAQSLMKALPQIPNGPRAVSTVADETACRLWLVSLMRKSPGKRTLSKAEAKTLWLEQGRKIGNKSFERAWNAATKEANAPAWTAPGRPKKNGPTEISAAL